MTKYDPTPTATPNLKSYRYLIIILAIAVSVAFQGSRGLYETSEGRYAEVGREMIETGNYMEPTLDYQPHWTKPPLTYWAIAGGIAVFGDNAWGARFFNIFAFLGATAAVYSIGILMAGETVGVIAALIYLSSLLPVAAANVVTTDTLLTMWELFGVMAYLRAYTHPDPTKRAGWAIGMWLFFGLAFFTKGPPALFPLLAIGLWQFLHPGRVRLMTSWGIPLFLVTAFSWIVWAVITHPDLLNYYFGHEIVDRLSSHNLHNSEWYKPFTMYLPALLFAGGPWIPIGIYFFLKKQHPVGRNRAAAFLRSDRPIVFAVYWALLPLIVFSLVKSRLVLYMLPLYAPLVLLAAYAMFRNVADTGRLLRSTAKLAMVLVALLLGVKGYAAFHPDKRNMEQARDTIRSIAPDAEVAVYDRSELYGMQFYTRGRMKRVSRTGVQPWADCGINTLLSDCKNPETGCRPCIIMTRDSHLPELHRLIGSAGLACENFGNGQWRYLLLKKTGCPGR